MDVYTVENVMIGFTAEELEELICSIEDLMDKAISPSPETLVNIYNKLKSAQDNTTQKWWETTETETTETGEQNADHA